MSEDPVDPGGETPGAAHRDGCGKGEQGHRQDQQPRASANRATPAVRAPRAAPPPPRPRPTRTIACAGARGPTTASNGAARRPHRSRPPGQPRSPTGQSGSDGRCAHRARPSANAHDIASGDHEPAEPAAPVRDPEQDVHGDDRQERKRQRLAEACQGKERCADGVPCACASTRAPLHSHDPPQGRSRAGPLGVGVRRAPGEGGHPGEGKGDDHRRPAPPG